jgi:hypothetical protein
MLYQTTTLKCADGCTAGNRTLYPANDALNPEGLIHYHEWRLGFSTWQATRLRVEWSAVIDTMEIFADWIGKWQVDPAVAADLDARLIKIMEAIR